MKLDFRPVRPPSPLFIRLSCETFGLAGRTFFAARSNPGLQINSIPTVVGDMLAVLIRVGRWVGIALSIRRAHGTTYLWSRFSEARPLRTLPCQTDLSWKKRKYPSFFLSSTSPGIERKRRRRIFGTQTVVISPLSFSLSSSSSVKDRLHKERERTEKEKSFACFFPLPLFCVSLGDGSYELRGRQRRKKRRGGG